MSKDNNHFIADTIGSAGYLDSGNRAHHSRPLCYLAEDAIQRITIADTRVESMPGKIPVEEHGRLYFKAGAGWMTASLAYTMSCLYAAEPMASA